VPKKAIDSDLQSVVVKLKLKDNQPEEAVAVASDLDQLPKLDLLHASLSILSVSVAIAVVEFELGIIDVEGSIATEEMGREASDILQSLNPLDESYSRWILSDFLSGT